MKLSSKFNPNEVVRLKDDFLPNAETREWVILEILNNGKVLLGRADKDYTWEASQKNLLKYDEEECISQV